MGIEEGADERSTMPDQIRQASAAAKRAEQAGEISSHESGRYRKTLDALRERILGRRLE